MQQRKLLGRHGDSGRHVHTRCDEPITPTSVVENDSRHFYGGPFGREISTFVEEIRLFEGKIRLALDEAAVAKVARQIVKEKCAAVAIALIHSYANPLHEKRVAAWRKGCTLGSAQACLSLGQQLEAMNVVGPEAGEAYLRACRERSSR